MRFLFLLAGLLALSIVAVPLLTMGLHLAAVGLVLWAAMTLLRDPRPRRHAPLPSRRRSVPLPSLSPSAQDWERLGEGTRRYPKTPPPAKATLPLDIQLKVDQIRHKAGALLGQREHFPFASADLYAVRATRDDYMPRTVAAYLAFAEAERERVMPGGKTPLQELKEQLTLLDAKLDEVAEDLQRQNFDRLQANGRFLEHRFGGPSVRV